MREFVKTVPILSVVLWNLLARYAILFAVGCFSILVFYNTPIRFFQNNKDMDSLVLVIIILVLDLLVNILILFRMYRACRRRMIKIGKSPIVRSNRAYVIREVIVYVCLLFPVLMFFISTIFMLIG